MGAEDVFRVDGVRNIDTIATKHVRQLPLAELRLGKASEHAVREAPRIQCGFWGAICRRANKAGYCLRGAVSESVKPDTSSVTWWESVFGSAEKRKRCRFWRNFVYRSGCRPRARVHRTTNHAPDRRRILVFTSSSARPVR
jgi:hypothetical protein